MSCCIYNSFDGLKTVQINALCIWQSKNCMNKYTAYGSGNKLELTHLICWYVNCNWNKEFATVDVEASWNLFKDKIDSGVKCCIPLTTMFQNTKWKRPLTDEIRDQIKCKKVFGDNMLEIKIRQAG